MLAPQSGNYATTYVKDVAIHRTNFARMAAIAGLLLLFVAFPIFAPSYHISVAIQVGIAVIGALGLNLLLGYAGQISIAHGAFLGVGAYTLAFITNATPIPFFLALPLAGVVAMLVGLIFGLPSVRIRGLYLAIATFAAQVIIVWILIHMPGIGGGTGATIVKRPSIGPFTFDSDRSYYFVVMAIVVLALVFSENIIRSRVGRAFIAVQEREISARVLGVNVSGYKLLAFMLSSFYAGVAGGLWGAYTLAISYEHFLIITSIQYLAMIIVGGLGSIVGSVYGAMFMVLMPLLLRTLVDMTSPMFPAIGTKVVYIENFFFGLVIVLFLIFEPRGLVQIWIRIKDYFRAWPFSY